MKSYRFFIALVILLSSSYIMLTHGKEFLIVLSSKRNDAFPGSPCDYDQYVKWLKPVYDEAKAKGDKPLRNKYDALEKMLANISKTRSRRQIKLKVGDYWHVDDYVVFESDSFAESICIGESAMECKQNGSSIAGNGITGNGTTGNGTTGNGITGNGTTGNGITGNGTTGNGTTPTARPIGRCSCYDDSDQYKFEEEDGFCRAKPGAFCVVDFRPEKLKYQIKCAKGLECKNSKCRGFRSSLNDLILLIGILSLILLRYLA